MNRWIRIVGASACLSAGLSLASLGHEARADDEAQLRFDEAMELLKSHSYDKACPKLQRVVELKPGKVGALVELAHCFDLWGKTASAWKTYQAVVSTASPEDERREPAKVRAEELGHRISTLTLLVPLEDKELHGFVVTLDGKPLSSAEMETPLPVDPGAHTIWVKAVGRKSWTRTLKLDEAASRQKLALPPLAFSDEIESQPMPVEDAPTYTQPTPVDAPTTSARPLWPIGLGYGITAAGLAAGIGTLVAAEAKPKSTCPTSAGCAAGNTFEANHNRLSNASLWTFVGSGAVAVATTGYLIWAVSGKKAPQGGTIARVVPLAGPGAQGLLVEGEF